MLWKLTDMLLGRRDLNRTDKLVIILLAKMQNFSNNCSASAGFIADALDVSERSVWASLRKLRRKQDITCKSIKKNGKENEINIYSLVWLNNWNRQRRHLEREARIEAVEEQIQRAVSQQ